MKLDLSSGLEQACTSKMVPGLLQAYILGIFNRKRLGTKVAPDAPDGWAAAVARGSDGNAYPNTTTCRISTAIVMLNIPFNSPDIQHTIAEYPLSPSIDGTATSSQP